MRRVEVGYVQCGGSQMVPARLSPINKKHRQHEYDGRRQDSVSSAHIELVQSDGGAPSLFFQQQRRDQVAGDDEKDSYSQVRKRPPNLPMVMKRSPVPDYDQRNRNGPESV